MANYTDEDLRFVDRVMNGGVSPRRMQDRYTLVSEEGPALSDEQMAILKQKQAANQQENQYKYSDVYKATMGDPDFQELHLNMAEKIGNSLDIPPTLLVNNTEAFQLAQKEYERQEHMAAMKGQAFSPQAVKDLYPELADIGNDDTVKAAIAIKNWKDLDTNRDIINGVTDARNVLDIISDGFDAGDDNIQIAQLGNKWMKAESEGRREEAEELREEIVSLSKRLETKRSEPEGVLNTILYATAEQAGQMVGGAKYDTSAILAGAAGGALVGSTFGGIGAIPGALAGGFGSMTWGSEGGTQYIQERMSGKSHESAKNSANLTGALNGAIEAVSSAFEVATLGIGKVVTAVGQRYLKKQMARAAIANAVREGIPLSGSRAAVDVARRTGLAMIPEVAEEGIQQAVGMFSHNIFSESNVRNYEARDILGESLNAMWQAIPATIGMVGGIGALSGIGHAALLHGISKKEMAQIKEAHQRVAEQNAVSHLLRVRDDMNLKKTAPEVYAQSVQAQMNREGLGTMYIDASTVAQTEEGRHALNQLVDDGVVTISEVEEAVKDGSTLAIQSGEFMQAVSQETASELAEHTTLTQGGETLYKIKMHHQALKEQANLVKETQEERNRNIAEAILERDFSKDEVIQQATPWMAGIDTEGNPMVVDIGRIDTSTQKEAMRSVLARGLEDLQKGYKEELTEAKKALGEFLNYDYYANYKGEGVGIVREVTEWEGGIIMAGGRGIRVSMNEPWYQEAFKKYGRKPNKGELWDVAEEQFRREMTASQEQKEDAIEAFNEYKILKERYDALVSIENYVKKIDQPDVVARTLLSDEAYNDVYEPAMKQMKNAPKNVKKAVKENALLLARMAQLMAKQYGVNVKDVAPKIQVGGESVTGAYTMPVTEKLDLNEQYTPVNLDEMTSVLPSDESSPSVETIVKYINKELAGKRISTKDMRVLLDFDGIGDGVNANHIVKAFSQKGRKAKQVRNIRNKTLENAKKILSSAVLVEFKNDGYIKEGYFANQEHDKKTTGKMRLVVPITFQGKNYSLVITVENFTNTFSFKNQAATVYEMYPRKINNARPEKASLKSSVVGDTSPVAFSIVDILGKVKDLNGNSYVDDNGKLNVKLNDGSIYNQRAYHGSPYNFDTFDLGAIGSGSGGRYHGWGIYFTANKEAAEAYKTDSPGARVYEVELPENDVLLNENATFFEQPKKVQSALKCLIKGLSLDELENVNDVRRLGKAKVVNDLLNSISGWSGGDIYSTLEDVIGEAEDVSRRLNKYGIKGVSYDDSNMGNNFVVFDDKAIEIINAYNQNAGDGNRGSFSPRDNLIRVFKQGNQSTIMHESAHWWMSTLEQLAKEGNQKAEYDLNTIRKWAAYSQDVMEEYRDTLLWNEFHEYEQKIQANPDDALARERFMQERFARAFERYLASGKAPSKELQPVFRKFKQWLTGIYRDIKKALGTKDAPKEIIAIFDKMLATDEEIEAWAGERELQRIEESGTVEEKNEREMISKWVDEVKEEAKERALKYYMDTIESDTMRSIDEELIPSAVEDYEKTEIEKNAVYQLEKMKDAGMFATDKAWREALEARGFTDKTYEDALTKAGGLLKDKTNLFASNLRKELIEGMTGPEAIRNIAEGVLETTEGLEKRTEIERKEFAKRLNKYSRVAAASLLALDREQGVTEATLAKHELLEIKARNGLLSKEEEEKILKQELRKAKKATMAEVKELKAELKSIQKGIREAETVMKVDPRVLKRQAEEMLYGKKVNEATNHRWWEQQAEAQRRIAGKSLASRQWKSAAIAKYKESKFRANAHAAKMYEMQVQKALHGSPKATTNTLDKEGLEKYGVIGIANRVGKKDGPRMTPHTRYFVRHMAYQLGLVKEDALAPVDKNGDPVPINFTYIANDLNAVIAMTAKENGIHYTADEVIPGWMKLVVTQQEQTPYTELTMEEFEQVMNAIKTVYKMGRRDYDGTVFELDGKRLSFEDAAYAVIQDINPDILADPFQKEHDMKLAERMKQTFSDVIADHALPEIMIERMGENAYTLIYKPIDVAAKKRRELQHKAEKKFNKVMNAYSKSSKEWREVREQKNYFVKINADGSQWMATKEEIICMALNWGTLNNRQRLCETYQCDELIIENALTAYMTEKDWDLVEGIWEHINSYWPARNQVQQNLYGVPLGKEPGIDFVTTNGRVVNGAYYPIKYNYKISRKAKDRNINEILMMDMMGQSSFALGMGSTKSRMKTSGGQSLRMDLDVYLEHIEESINHIAMRESTADVYKLLNRDDVADAIQIKYGLHYHNILKQWASDNWATPLMQSARLESWADRLRGNFSKSIMGYRLSTAALNLANIVPMMKKVGVQNGLRYFNRYVFSRDFGKTREFVFSKSAFLASRASNIDKDLQQGMKFMAEKDTWLVTQYGKDAVEAANKYGWWLIAETDLLCSIPEWMCVYEAVMKDASPNLTPEQLEEKAILQADKAVRETFGSGELKDQPVVAKRGWLRQFMPFYTFTSLLTNQWIRAGYMKADGKGYGELVAVTLIWGLVFQGLGGLIRSGLDGLSGDDRYSWYQRVATEIAGGPFGAFAGLRDLVPNLIRYEMGMYSEFETTLTAGTILEDFGNLIKIAQSERSDWIDLGRQFFKFGNRLTGSSDTLSDGFWNLMRLTVSETDADLQKAIMYTLLDKKIKPVKKKESKRKNAKKKEGSRT